MPQNDGINVSAFESHLNAIYPNIPTDMPPLGLDLFPPPSRQTGIKQASDTKPVSDTKPPAGDLLRGAIDANNLTPVEQADAAKVAALPPEAAILAQAARDRLAQEALLADPAEMRQLFPQLLKDLDLEKNAHLDMAEIDQALAQKQLSEPERNFLIVLKDGYPVLSDTTSGASNPEGVSADSLAIIDKAMNRSLKENPIYSQDAAFNLKMGVGVGLAVGAFWGRSSVETAAISAAAGAVINTALLEGETWVLKESGYDDHVYNAVQKDYKTLVDNYDHPKASGSS